MRGDVGRAKGTVAGEVGQRQPSARIATEENLAVLTLLEEHLDAQRTAGEPQLVTRRRDVASRGDRGQARF